MAKYKNILTGYINDSKIGKGKYLTITNVGDEDVILRAGDKLFLNMTPDYIKEKNPKVPNFSKSIKIESEEDGRLVDEAKEALIGDEEDKIPF